MIAAHRGLQALRSGIAGIADGIGDAHRADERLARGERADQTDPHFPIKSQRTKAGFHPMAETAGEAVFALTCEDSIFGQSPGTLHSSGFNIPILI